eukprot:6730732-Pyramimonas_sp.AAC.1
MAGKRGRRESLAGVIRAGAPLQGFHGGNCEVISGVAARDFAGWVPAGLLTDLGPGVLLLLGS